jgi:putative SOS response-associated peptidase YedK
MCTRYASDLTMDDWAQLYDLATQGPVPWNFQPNYNVVITETIPVVVLREGKRVLERMRWGVIPGFHKGTIKEFRAATYNTRDDTVEKSGLWKRIWKRNRCLIPVSGFYEWYHRPGKPKKEPPQPYYFTDANGSPALTIAGIFDSWRDPENDGRELLSCSMMTTEPNARVAKVHDRQVVTLRPDQFSSWLDGTAGTEALVPAPEDAIRYWPVSTRINSVKTAQRDDRTLIEPITLEHQAAPALLV